MPEQNHTEANSEHPKKRNRYSPRAAYAQFQLLPVGLRYMIWAAFIVVAVVAIVSLFFPNMKDRIKFFTDSSLNVLIVLVVAVQAYIYTKQWGAMTEGLAIERAKTDPRLRIAEVTAQNFEVGERPTFIVTIANDGLIAATGVKVHMGVEIDVDKELDWIHDPIVTIPASGKEHYFILSSSWLEQQHIDAFNNAVALRVVGFFDYWPVGRTDFCYRYLPWEGPRPEGIPQFVPCDFEPRLNTTLRITGAQVRGEVGTVTAIVQRNPPEEEAKPESKDE
jgi:hypothetical protein